MGAIRLLIVDDDVATSESLEEFFHQDGFLCTQAETGAAALEALKRTPVDVVISDIRMDGMNGFELLERLTKAYPSLPVVLMTGKSAIPEAVDAMKRGAYDYVTKPCDLDELRAILIRAVEDAHRRAAGATSSQRIEVAASRPETTAVGDSPAMCALREAVERVAASSAPVLLLGETGAGKELVARAIHAKSARHARRFVAVNTSAIPSELLEGEIFGHARGAFTGASQARKGLLSEADGGTLLLDEIGDMPLLLQAKLLRVLQFGEVRPVGSDQSHHVDVRFIAATHRDLAALIREGRFREDLFFRLNVLPVVVPPLRDRREDVPSLVAHFLAEAKQRAPGSPVRDIAPETIQLLMDAPWPGNVRELESTIERLVVFGQDEVITPRSLVDILHAAPGSVHWPGGGPDPWPLRRITDEYIAWVLAQNGGDKQRAAKVLGVDVSTLYRRMRTA